MAKVHIGISEVILADNDSLAVGLDKWLLNQSLWWTVDAYRGLKMDLTYEKLLACAVFR